LTDRRAPSAANKSGAERKVAAVGTVASLTALLSATACCVLPFALAGVGIGVGGLATLVPYRWPLTIAALVMVGAGWFLYLRKRRACALDPDCGAAPSAATLVMLCIASVVVAICALWGFVEQPLMRALGGA
jgi:mercuric ion transport protein